MNDKYTSFINYFLSTKHLVKTNYLSHLEYPIEIYLEIIDDCNLKCKYCYKYNSRKKSKKYLPIDLIKKVIYDIPVPSNCLLVLEGGEPFLHPNILEIIEICKDLKLNMDIITNGTFFHNKMVYQLEKVYDNDLFDIQISIDGLGQINSLARGINSSIIIEGIKRLNSCNIIPRINCVLTKYNYKDIINFLNYIQNHIKVSAVSISRVFGKSNISLDIREEQTKQLLNDLGKNQYDFPIDFAYDNKIKNCSTESHENNHYIKCTALRSKVCISYDGSIYPCVFYENIINPIDTIINKNLVDIWKSEKADQFRIQLFEEKKNCFSCVYNRNCIQHCIAEER